MGFSYIRRREIFPPILLSLALLAVYWRLVLLKGILITDDIFTSDIMNEGFPYRYALGSALHRGELPLWFTTIYGGFPLLARAEAGAAYPMNLLAFGLLPPYVALNLVIAATVLIAGLGAYLYSRELDVDPPGAVLAGLAFGLSGFMVSHLKHLSMVNAACWLPWGLLLLERGIVKNRPRTLVWLSAVFGLQVLSGHIQIAYYAGLLYATYACVRLLMIQPEGKRLHAIRDRRTWWVAASVAVAVLLGGIQLLPTYELVNLSQRAGGVTFDYATLFNFDPASLGKLFFPWVNGEIGDLSYRGTGIYWEEYGYVGLLTMVIALFAIAGGVKRWDVRFFALTMVLALALALGKSTPVFEFAFTSVPFLKYFRFPTRFLAIADLSIAVLGGIGVSLLAVRVHRRSGKRDPGGMRRLLPWIIVGLTFVDLAYHQSRQNAIAPMRDWAHEPATATDLRPMLEGNRFFSLGADLTHKVAFQKAGGWLGSLEPYTAQREFLQPSSNVLYDLPSPNGYAQLTPNYVVDVWGDQNRSGLMQQLWRVSGQTIETRAPFKRLLSMHNVAYVLSPLPIIGESLPLERRSGDVYVYKNPECMPRAFLVGATVASAGGLDDLKALVSPRFDPRREAIVDASLPYAPADSLSGDARIVAYRSNDVTVRTSANAQSVLVLSDMYYPGWEATVDGKASSMFRVNGTMRGVIVPAGVHEIRYAFRPWSVRLGAMVSAAGIALLCAGLVYTRKTRS